MAAERARTIGAADIRGRRLPHAAVGFVKRREGIDVYAVDTDFTPFRVGA
jgi:hypothetical protein